MLKPYKLASLKDKIEAIEEKNIETADEVEPAEVKPRKTKKGMNKGNSTLTVILAIAFVVALGVTYFGTTGTKGDRGDKGVQGIQGLKGDKGDRGLQGLQGLAGPRGLPGLNGINAKLGAFPGPDLYVPYLSVNDVTSEYTRLSLGSSWAGTEGTTTPCRIRSFQNSTSTLALGYPKIHINEQATATYIQLGRATAAANAGNIFATTTLIGDKYDLPASVSASIVGSTTASQTLTATTFGPGEFLVMRIAGGTAGTQRLTGTCEAVFEKF